MSRIDMNIPNTMIRNAISRRGAIRSDGAAVGFIIASEAVVASAMMCSAQDAVEPGARPDARGLLRLHHRRRVEVGVAVGIPGALAGIDGGIDRHAGTQQVLFGDILWHANPDRKPLPD